MRRKDGREKSGSRWVIKIELIVLLAFVCVAISRELESKTTDSAWQEEADGGREADTGEAIEVSSTGDYIKWVEFHVTCEALAAAYELDVASCQEEVHLDWIELLACVGARHGASLAQAA